MLVVLIHIVAGTAIIAGNVAALGSTLVARRNHSPRVIGALMTLHHFAVVLLVVPGAMLALATGLYLVHDRGLPFDAPWLISSYVLWGLSLLVGILVLLPAESNAIREAARQVDAGEAAASDDLRHHIAKPAVVWGEWLAMALAWGFLFLMVYRPS